MTDANRCKPSRSDEEKSFGIVGQINIEDLRTTFPSWRLSGVPGYWYAVRGGVAYDGPRSLLRCYLGANTLVALADKLCLQDFLDGLSDHELVGVWQRATLAFLKQDAS